MAIVIENALLADIDPIRIEPGELRIDGDTIVERGKSVSRETAQTVIDAGGALVLPGLVNGHTHLYSALAVGMPNPAKPPQDFKGILESVWWRLDRALDAESIETSARIGALDALRCGATTLFDHHASPNHIAGSLDLVEKGVSDVGLRAILCYETTDRHGPEGRAAGLEENRRYLEKRGQQYSPHFAGMVGAHASFTLEDETLQQLAWLADDFDAGVHIHVAEDVCDEEDCQERFQTFLLERLGGYKLLRRESIFAHGTHLAPDAIGRVSEIGATLAHCPRSNMNNAAGTAPMAAYKCPVMIGTDGHSPDMFFEARVAWLAARQDNVSLPPEAVIARLAHAARRASDALHITLGKLEPEAAADLIITDYRPSTPLTSENLAAHLLFGMSGSHVKHVIAGGELALRDRAVTTCDENKQRGRSTKLAQELWARMNALS